MFKDFPKEISIKIFHYLDYVTLYCCYRVSKKSIKIIEQMMENKKNNKGHIKTYSLCSNAAKYGYLGILQWLRSENCYWDELTCSNAAKNGNLNMLQWARNKGCPWDEWVCTYAAINEDLDMLQWVLDEDYPWHYSWYGFLLEISGVVELDDWDEWDE